MPRPYLRFPALHAENIAVVADDDLWLGRLPDEPDEPLTVHRLTSDRAPVRSPRFSPAGDRIAYTGFRDGAPEAYVIGVDGVGAGSRLTFYGDPTTRVLGWIDNATVVVATSQGEAFASRTFADAVPIGGGAARRLPYGPITALAIDSTSAVLLGRDQSPHRGASWKRYRGGTAAKIWLDPTGEGTFHRLLADLDAQLEDPAWMDGRVVFVSDHEGSANIYSVTAKGDDLRRHSDHTGFAARALVSDGRRCLYARAGSIWLLGDATAQSRPHELDVRPGGELAGRRPTPARLPRDLAACWPDHEARASLLEVRGRMVWLAHRDGPARQLDLADGRARLPRLITGPAGPTTRAVWVSDAEGEDALETAPVFGPRPPTARRLAGGHLGRVLDLAAAPNGRFAATAGHDGRIVLVDLEGGRHQVVERNEHGDASGLAFSPDSRWLAWSAAGPQEMRQIRLAPLDSAGAAGEPVAATPMRFLDTEPVFTLDGQYLAFLSTRTFDPVYDQHAFDMSFPAATRPYLLVLAGGGTSPFAPTAQGRAFPAARSHESATGSVEVSLQVDLAGLVERVVAVPVAAGRYQELRAVRGGLVYRALPVSGVLGQDRARTGDQPGRAQLMRIDLVSGKEETLLKACDGVVASGDGTRLVVRDQETVRVIPAERPPRDEESEDRIEVDLDRVQVWIDPGREWLQMFDENGRLMRDHFWVPDMAGVDWPAVLEAYRPLVDVVSTRDDLSELLWELHGELGSSHAYEMPRTESVEASLRVGHLGARLSPGSDGRWRIDSIAPAEISVPGARNPLTAPGVEVTVGDVLVAVEGRSVDPLLGPGPLLVGTAERAVELTVVSPGGAPPRTVVVIPLAETRPLHYHAWVAQRRHLVHEATGGRVGYLHVPDMMGAGWAELHRDLTTEVARDALLVDLRYNGGGHVSQLVLEKLARFVTGWSVNRHLPAESYPQDAPRGPMVALVNELAGSDGDIVTAGWRRRSLGPLVGMRTWGGVIGIDMRYCLVDGTRVTQPRYAYWFDDVGWAVENRGVEPDVVIDISPQDWVAGRDPQLDRGLAILTEAMAARPPARPPSLADRPDRRPPPLGPRPSGRGPHGASPGSVAAGT